MDYIHYDLWMSKGEAQYLLIFIDDYSRQVWMHFLKRKSDVVITFNKKKLLDITLSGLHHNKIRLQNV